MKINDLSEAQKLDRLFRELRGTVKFQEAALYAECTDTILNGISSEDSGRKWHKLNANTRGTFQRSF